MSITIDAEALKTVASWAGGAVYLGVDIGATNTRVCLSKHVQHGYVVLTHFKCGSVSVLLGGLKLVVEALKGISVKIAAAALDAAGPVTIDKSGLQKVVVTNWSVSEEERTLHLSMLPQELFPPGHCSLLNDLEAGCFGILALNAQGKMDEIYTPLWGEEKSVKLAPCHHLILAMGTGLGVGALIFDGKQYTVLPMEVGHTLVHLFGPRHKNTPDDSSLLAFASEALYEGTQGVEFEDVCSGRGLVLAYKWVMKKEGKDTTLSSAEEISHLATKGDAFATRAMLEHYRLLVRVAQNMCVALQAKGVILAGDNQVNNKEFVQSHTLELQEEFLQHPKKHWLVNTPVFAQTTKCNTMALGCLYKASTL